MVISFDIDNTLIPYSDEFEVEYVSPFFKFLGVEPIRKGSRELYLRLLEDKHEFWVYTTSHRSKLRLYLNFKYFGITPRKIINGQLNARILKLNNCQASKNPKLFGIVLHVDDSEGVKLEGNKYGFEALIVEVNNKNWVNEILLRINDLCK